MTDRAKKHPPYPYVDDAQFETDYNGSYSTNRYCGNCETHFTVRQAKGVLTPNTIKCPECGCEVSK